MIRTDAKRIVTLMRTCFLFRQRFAFERFERFAVRQLRFAVNPDATVAVPAFVINHGADPVPATRYRINHGQIKQASLQVAVVSDGAAHLPSKNLKHVAAI